MSLIKNEKTKIEKPQKEKKGSPKLILIVLSLIAAISSFIFLLHLEKQIMTNYEKQEVVVVKKELPANLLITEANANEYLKLEQRESITLPEDVICTIEEMYDRSSQVRLLERNIMSRAITSDLAKIKEEIGNVTELSFSISSIGQAINGSIRGGDYINIYLKTTNEAQTKKQWQKLYVLEATNGSGEIIEVDAETNEALNFTILINKDDVATFLEGLSTDLITITNVSELVNSGKFEYEGDTYVEYVEEER